MKKILIITLLLFCINLMYGQYIPINMEYKVENSSLIVEGKVILKKCYIGDDDEIYTKNFIQITNVFKGEIIDDKLTIITLGGTVDDISVSWTHLPYLSVGDFGTFFLKQNSLPTKQVTSEEQEYNILTGSQGFYLYKNKDSNSEVISVLDQFESRKQFYQKVGLSSMENIFLSQKENDNCLNFKIKLIDSDFSQKSSNINFELLVYVDSGTYFLEQAEAYIGYSDDWFSQNIISQGKLNYTTDSIFLSGYTFATTDYSSNILHLNLQNSNHNNYVEVSEIPKRIAIFSLAINNISGENPFWQEDEQVNNTFFNGQVELPFPCSNFFYGECDPAIVINSVFPMDAAAGVKDFSTNVNPRFGYITITGNNFLQPHATIQYECNKPIGHYVLFETNDGKWISPLEGDYKIYTNTEIKVRVPSIGYIIDENCNKVNYDPDDNNRNTAVASTGKVKVIRPLPPGSSKCSCSQEMSGFTVPFAARNTFQLNKSGCRESVRALLRNANDKGGYTIRYHPNFKAQPAALAPFKRAVSTWRCATKVNFEVDEDGTIVSMPGFCIISFRNLPFGTTVVTRAGTSFNVNSCGDSPDIDFSESNEGFNLAFNKKIDWHFGTDMPNLNWNVFGNPNNPLQADLESIALHELGHAHLLLHTKNSSDVMIRPGVNEYRRSLDSHDDIGGNHISRLSSQTKDDECTKPEMLLIDVANCEITPVIQIGYEVIKFELFPNPVIDELSINAKNSSNLLSGSYAIFDKLGRLINTYNIDSSQISIDVSSFNSGVYFVTYIYNSNNFVVGKFIKL